MSGTRVCLLFSGTLLVCGIIVDNPALLAGATLFLLAVGVKAIGLNRTLQHCARALQIERTLSHHIVRQGRDITVTTRLSVVVPPGYRLTLRDELPRGARRVQGVSEVTLSQAWEGAVTLTYTMRVLSRGALSFEGLSLTIANHFFSDHLKLGGGAFAAPSLLVQPAPAYAAPEPQSLYGTHELDRLRAIQGQGIRAFRPFHHGDDQRAIDWKLTAKHGKLMLREYAGRAGGSPVFVLDLPLLVEEEQGPAYDRLIANLTERVERAVREYRHTDLLVLSGGRVIRSLSPLNDAREWYRLLHQLVPGDGFLPLFRSRDLQAVRSFHQRIQRSARQKDADIAPFFHRLARIIATTMATRPRSLLEHQVVAALRRSGEREVMVYSLLQGDLSHLRQLVGVVRTLQMKVHLNYPQERGTIRDLPFSTDTAEVIT